MLLLFYKEKNTTITLGFVTLLCKEIDIKSNHLEHTNFKGHSDNLTERPTHAER